MVLGQLSVSKPNFLKDIRLKGRLPKGGLPFYFEITTNF